MNLVSLLVISEVFSHTRGIGIEYQENETIERKQAFGAPIPLTVALKLANTVLREDKPVVRAFDANGTIVGEWHYNPKAQDNSAMGNPRAEKVKGVSRPRSAESVKKSTRESDAEQLAKAPRAQLPFMFATSVCLGMNKVATKLTRGLHSVPVIHSESKVSVTLTRTDGKTVTIPIHQGLFVSAVSRGKALLKDDPKTGRKGNPNADINIYVKRLIADLLLGTDTTEVCAGEEKGEKEFNRTCYTSALLVSSKLQLRVSRDECISVQADCKVDTFKRKVRQVMSKKMIPFGQGYGWRGRAKDTIAKFSHG